MKGEDGVSVPDTRERTVEIENKQVIRKNYDGLKMIFKLAAQGKTDRDIAITLNSLCFKTTGLHDPRFFSKDTIKAMIKSKFFIGYVRDGEGGWLKAKHKPFVDPILFEEAQNIRGAELPVEEQYVRMQSFIL